MRGFSLFVFLFLPPSSPHSTDLPPVAIVSSDASAHWVSLAWSSPPAHRYPLVITGFFIYYAKQADLPSPGATALRWFRNVTVNPKQESGNVTGLEPSTVYVFLVGYQAREYWSELSVPLSVTTAESELI